MSVGEFSSVRETPPGVEYEAVPTIRRREHNRSLYKRNFDVPDPVLDQRDVSGAVEIADFRCCTLSDHRVLLPEIDHPLATELNRRRLG
ncbi:hypothetical protein [Humibacter albus]|uniref:hypothetical protein n=1 Tax=Humibacter albus TaxID=427754 RepID=UPI0012FC64B0|nr:hypothetical protein [Humibacter albus]